MNDSKKRGYKKSERLLIQERDISVFGFLDRIGYANLEQITAWLGLSGEKSQAAVLRRLYLLRRFGYLKVFSTQNGNYYALDKLAQGENALIKAIKLEQLSHHNFLTELFLLVQDETVITEREAIAQFKVVGKKGKVPDMVINDWIIEYERTNKSVNDSKAVVDYWTAEQAKSLCIIYESEQIRNRYQGLLNPRVRLLHKNQFTEILKVLAKVDVAVNNVLDEVKNKYS